MKDHRHGYAVPPLAGGPDPSGAQRSGSEGGAAVARARTDTPLVIQDGGPPASGGTVAAADFWEDCP